MTLKRNDGKLSLMKISLLFGIFASVAMVAMAVQPTLDIIHKVASPWIDLPQKIDRMDGRLARIENAMNIAPVNQDSYTTNRQMRTVQR